MQDLTCGFIGLGLIGGSIAKAIKENIPSSRIIAYDINQETLQMAKDQAVADIITTSIDSTFSQCDYIFLCAPVQKNDANLLQVKNILSKNCLLTDVGSVKSDIHTAIREAGLEKQFIGGHPMAGSERIGFVHSKAMLLQNAYYILTPTEESSPEKLKEYKALVETIGAIPLILNSDQHDYVTAAISHVPHVIAASLVNLVKNSDSKDGIMKMIAAGGFKDITRIASSSSTMWQQICLTNADNISKLLGDYIDSLQAFKETIDSKDKDELYNLFNSARIYRDSFINESSGPIKRNYFITIDITDKPGALAAIASLFALNEISIKNIGIVHNREYEGGVLRIEFYEEASINRAKEILIPQGYTIYEHG